jgi:DNA-binding beta-propeller fold protein YncE
MKKVWLEAMRASCVAFMAAIVPLACATGQQRPIPAQELLYVCIQDDAKIAVVDMTTLAVVRTIDLRSLGFPATAKPHYIVVEPDGAHWYVSLIGANRVAKFDRNDRVVAQFEMETPGMLSLSPGSDALAISRSMSAVNPPSRVAVVQRSTMRGDEIDVLFPRPHPMVIAPNGRAYTGSLGVNQIASISLGDERVEIVPVAGSTHSFVQFAISPDGRTLVGTTDVSGQLMAFDLGDPAKPRLVKSIDVGKMAFDPTFTPDGRHVYVPVKSTNRVVIVETSTWTVTARIEDPAFRQPHQIVFSADGRTAFVTNNNKMDHMADPAAAAHDAHTTPTSGAAAVAVIDVAARRVVKTIELGKNLTGMGTRGGR